MYYQASPYFRSQYPVRPSGNKLKVFGEGTVSAQPDQATVVLGVVTEDANLQQAQETNANHTTNVINALLKEGIPRENIRTSEYRVDMNYDFQDGVQVFRGYRVTNLLTITIDELNRVGEIVDIAVDNGANTVRNVILTISDKEGYYNNALTKAIQNAQQKAAVVGETLGVTIDETPVQIKELGGRSPEEPRPFVLGVSTEKASTTPIEAGQLQVTAVVEAYFQY
jgi:uncharacterized protein